MSEMRHERPGVYSVYDASSVTSAGRAAKRIGVAALAVKGTANTAVTLTGYGAGVEVFGEDGADTPGMSTLLKLLFANGASTVCAVRVDTGADLEAYQAAFAAFLVIGFGCAPIYPCIIHSTPSNFGAENSGAIIGIQMASAYIGTTFIPPIFGILGNSIGFFILPLYLLVFVALMITMVEVTFRITKNRNSL